MSKLLNMSHRFLIGLLAMALLLAWSTDGLAFKLFSADMEKPNPQFTRNDGQISAKLIPRAKSGSVIINFKVIDGGTLAGHRSIGLNLDVISGIALFDVHGLLAGAVERSVERPVRVVANDRDVGRPDV